MVRLSFLRKIAMIPFVLLMTYQTRNQQIHNKIRANNVTIAKNGEKLQQDYLKLISQVTDKYYSAVNLNVALQNIPLLINEIDSMKLSVEIICNKVMLLDQLLTDNLIDNQHANIRKEQDTQALAVEKTTEMWKQKLLKAEADLKEQHRNLKIAELAKRQKKE
ncbi:hypothetical protein RFI_15678 [Reticulomyxa filosa]|uniref:Uncharacterized protein n=1 Tax=Reticulomyxa filosa TaxID=46433 RepID=X6N677_RETFI|nr:hypothetical protein RFI_15678 [Reticulomyxa filosa]|eukprot:ETO21526.1 hypothetical protein RFI_15678 [Reticulomyxa filosa]